MWTWVIILPCCPLCCGDRAVRGDRSQSQALGGRRTPLGRFSDTVPPQKALSPLSRSYRAAERLPSFPSPGACFVPQGNLCLGLLSAVVTPGGDAKKHWGGSGPSAQGKARLWAGAHWRPQGTRGGTEQGWQELNADAQARPLRGGGHLSPEHLLTQCASPPNPAPPSLPRERGRYKSAHGHTTRISSRWVPASWNPTCSSSQTGWGSFRVDAWEQLSFELQQYKCH